MKYNTLLGGFALLISLTFCKSHEDNVITNDENLKVGQLVSENKEFNISSYRFALRKTPDSGKPYGIYDNYISAKEQVLLKELLSFDTNDWLFNNYDAEDDNKQRSFDNTAWINNQDPLLFSTTELNKKIVEAVKDVSKEDGPYYPYKVFAKILRRGDNTKVVRDSEDEEEYSATIFMNEHWRKNYYGEFYLYDDNKEIIGGATHKSARLVVWRSDIYRLNRPPAVQFLQGQVLFHVVYSKDKSKMEQAFVKYNDFREKRAEAHSKWNMPHYQFPEGQGIEQLDIDAHKTMEYTTQTDGRKIFIFDDLFPKEILDGLRSFVLEYGTYFYDDSVDSDSDNVQWVAGFHLDPYIKSPYWKIIQKAAHHVTGNKELFPYDVSINLIRNADFTRIHTDVGYDGEEEYTCLVYLNPNWKKDYFGETTFFERNSDDTDIVAQVKPKYGRLVIFDGNIPHSARPPSFTFTGARLSFVTKLHRNEFAGRYKNFQEELRFFRSTVGMNFDLKTLGSDEGEEFAKTRLDGMREMKMKLNYHPDPEMEEVRHENDDEEENEDGEDDAEERKEPANKREQKEEHPPPKIPKQDEEPHLKPGQLFIRRENSPLTDAEDDPITRKLLKPLDALTEETPDAVKLLREVHDTMLAKEKKFLQRFREKGFEIL